jgi:acetyltransferase-like isoleucine patch superfamily enzyme
LAKGIRYTIRKWLKLREELSFGYYITDFLFRKLLRQNSGVSWAMHHSSTVHWPDRIVRGKNVFPGDSPGVYINAANGIEIGDYTNIGPGVGIISANHDFIDNDRFSSGPPVVIGRHCWIGKGATILPGVVLGDFTIVGAGAVVTRNFDGYCVIAGNPAKKLKDLDRKACTDFAASKQT